MRALTREKSFPETGPRAFMGVLKTKPAVKSHEGRGRAGTGPTASCILEYYQLSSKSPSPETPDKVWFAEAKKSVLCKSCNAPRPSTKGIDVTVQGMPDRSALNFVPGVCIGVAEISFLRALLPEGPENFLRVGKVFDSKQRESPDVVTFMGHKTIVIRGGPKPKPGFRLCPECSRISYSPLGKRYVLKHEVGNAPVLDAWFGTLIVTNAVAQRVIGGKWKNLVMQKIEVRDEPIDGVAIPTGAA